MKKLVSILASAALLIPMLSVPASAETAAAKNWEFDGSVMGFGGNKSQLTSVGGSLIQTIENTESNTFILSPNGLDVDASVYKYLTIRVKNQTTAEATICYQAIGTNQSAFSNSMIATSAKIPVDDDFHEYKIDLSSVGTEWSGTISRFRLRLTPYSCSGAVYVDYIRLEADDGKEYQFTGGAEGWAVNKGTASASAGVLTHSIPASTNNAFITSPNNLNIPGGAYKYIKIRLKSSIPSTGFGVVFATTDHAIDSSTASFVNSNAYAVVQGTGIAAGNEYKEYVIDMSGNANWTGKTIQRIRLLSLMPNNSSNEAGTMQIDWIKLTADNSVTAVNSQEIALYEASVYDNEDGETFNAGFTAQDEINPSDYTYLKFKLGDSFRGIAIDDTELAGVDGDILLGIQLNNIEQAYKGNVGLNFTTEVPVE